MKKLMSILILALFFTICLSLIPQNSQASYFGFSFRYHYGSGSNWLPNRIVFKNYYGYPSMYWGFRSYRPIHYGPTPYQYVRDNGVAVKVAEQKYLAYLVEKQRQEEETIKAQKLDVPVFEDNMEPEIKLEVKEKEELPPLDLPEENDQPKPKEIEVIEAGSVVIAMY